MSEFNRGHVRARSIKIIEGFAGEVHKIIQKRPNSTLSELSDKLDSGISKIKAAIELLREKGVLVEVTDDTVGLQKTLPVASEWEPINVDKFTGKRIKWGVIADTHLCSKYCRLDVLNALFDIYEQDGIKEVFVLGNMIDGEFPHNKHDLLTAPGLESQTRYFIENWPKRSSITTKFLTGDDHEGWYVQSVGVDVGRYIEDSAKQIGRTDLRYIGHMEYNMELKAKNESTFVRMIHAGGGSSYATSYTSQKYVESLQGGEKPAVVLVGHFHKFEYGYPREVHVVQVGAVQDQTPWMRKKRIQTNVGGTTISFELDRDGILHRFMPEFHPFYDRAFYKGTTWKYHWK
uniref:Putative calcineurin-like phosphoesterase n=1 Tax=viral metagenome TaxID=1070528 RepID=A0A6M3K0H8_9ZZZZ